MNTLQGMLIKHLVDLGTSTQSKWVASTLDNRSVVIKYEFGSLTVTIEGSASNYASAVHSPTTKMTTEVMLLLTGLRAV